VNLKSGKIEIHKQKGLQMLYGLFEILLIFMLAFIYFIPTVVAYSKGHRNALAILILNLFLGYTLLGWVAALIWAVYKSEPAKKSKR